MRRYARLAFLFFSSLLACGTHFADISGEIGQPSVYRGAIEVAGGECRVLVEIDRLQFLLTSMADKYKVLRARLENAASSPLELSSQADTLDLILSKNGQTTQVRAILDLGEADSVVWRSLDATMQEALAYPVSVPGARDPGLHRPEVLHFFFFVPKDSVGSLPVAFEYTIASLGKTIRIEPPPRRAE